MIARRRFLLEGVFVLFVDDDQTQLAGRCEDGAAGPDDDLNLSGGDAPPVSAALRVGQVAVEYRDVAAPAAEPLDRLRRQRDFRDENDGFLPALDDVFNSPQVDFGFAAAGDSVKQKRVVAPG